MKILFTIGALLLQTYALASNTLSAKLAPLEAQLNQCSDYQSIDCVKKKLSTMVKIDQLLRVELKSKDDESSVKRLTHSNQEHAKQLRQILDAHFWVKKSVFGKETDNHAWLIVQHADHDPDLQHRALYILEKMLFEGETDVTHYAYLLDRVAVRYKDFGIKQKYGTQAHFENGKVAIMPYEGSESDLDRRRRQIGLDPIKDYLAELNVFYGVSKEIS